MWLDGLCMAEPFYALRRDARAKAAPSRCREAVPPDCRAYVRSETVLHHAWDESRHSGGRSADGLLPHFLGRSIGWFAMGLVDVLDIFPAVIRAAESCSQPFRSLRIRC